MQSELCFGQIEHISMSTNHSFIEVDKNCSKYIEFFHGVSLKRGFNVTDLCHTPGFELVIGSVTLILFVISTVGIIVNGLVFVIVFKTRGLRKPSNALLLSLAAADLLFCFIIFTSTILVFKKGHTHITRGWPCLRNVCGIFLQCAASTWSLCAVSLDRYLSIRCPLRHRRLMTPSTVAMVITIIWLWSAALASFMFIPFPETKLTWHICNYKTLTFNEQNMGLYSILGGVIPLFCTIGLYILIVRIAHHHDIHVARDEVGPHNSLYRCHLSDSEQDNSDDTKIMSLHNKSKCISHQPHIKLPSRTPYHHHKTKVAKSSKVLCIIAVNFIIWWSPLLITHIIYPICEACRMNYGFVVLTYTSFIGLAVTKITNPCIYTLRNREFKHGLHQLGKWKSAKCKFL